MNSPPKIKRGASITGKFGLSRRLESYGSIHLQTCVSSLGRLLATPVSTATAVLVVAVALSLPGLFYCLVENIRLVSERFVDSNQITLYLKTDITNAKAAELAEDLVKFPEIRSVEMSSKEEALEEFRQYSGFAAAVDILDSNPLPALIHLQPESKLSSARLKELIQKLESFPESDFAQFDLTWVRRLKAIVNVIQRAIEIIGLLLGVGVVFVVSNTIRLELRNRQSEIIISKLLGATDSFIRRPFLYSGFWYGLGGGLGAVILVNGILFLFQGPVKHLSLLYESDYQIVYPDFFEMIGLLAASSLLGIAGAWLVLFDQLHKMNPDK